MSTSCPLPVRASVRDLLADLLGREVGVAAGQLQLLADGKLTLAAVYVDDADAPAAAAICDLALAHASGAAIGTLPPAAAAEEVATGKLEGDTREFFNEVVNVFAKLLNAPGAPHVRLGEVYELPGNVPVAAANVLTAPLARADYDVSIDAYGGGKLTVLVA